MPREDIKKFADTAHWLTYFPPIAKEDITNFGGRVDWRRSFVTTPANPYYDSFVRWQMNKLKALNYISESHGLLLESRVLTCTLRVRGALHNLVAKGQWSVHGS